MVLVMFILALCLHTSWQEESTEKTLNQMLDQLLEDTVVSAISRENVNSSRIIYLKDPAPTRRTQESRLDALHSGEYEDLEDLVRKIAENTDITKRLDDRNQDSNEVTLNQATLEYERHVAYNQNEDHNHETTLLNKGFSNSGKPLFEDISDNTYVSISSRPTSNFIRTRPQIIQDEITHEINNQEIGIKDIFNQNNEHAYIDNVSHFTENREDTATQILDSLVKFIMSGSNSNKLAETDDANVASRSMVIHNDIQEHVINHVPLAYELSPHGKMLLRKLTQGYSNIQSLVKVPNINRNLRVSRWESNAGRNSLMDIPRVRHLGVRLNPRLNVVPSIVYHPFYHHTQYI